MVVVPVDGSVERAAVGRAVGSSCAHRRQRGEWIGGHHVCQCRGGGNGEALRIMGRVDRLPPWLSVSVVEAMVVVAVDGSVERGGASGGQG